MRTTTLGDGTVVACISASEARVLDAHVDGYLDHGITLPDDAVVLDVGANIGLLGVRLAQRLPQARVFAFEPIPTIHAVCADNARRHGQGRITPLPFGLSSTPGRLQFTYYPRCPALSTAHPEDWERPGAFAEAVRGNLKAASKVVRAASLVPGFMAPVIARFLMSGSQQVDAELRTASSILDDHDLDRIDLLKIDCEGAELEVMRGVSDAHWPRIRQVVAEVHDLDGRLDAVKALLTRHGFDAITVDREAGFEDTRLSNIFARRTAA